MAEGNHTSLGNCYSLEVDRELFPFPCAGGQLTRRPLSLSLRLSLNQSEKETRGEAPSNVQYYITLQTELIFRALSVCMAEYDLKKHIFQYKC